MNESVAPNPTTPPPAWWVFGVDGRFWIGTDGWICTGTSGTDCTEIRGGLGVEYAPECIKDGLMEDVICPSVPIRELE